MKPATTGQSHSQSLGFGVRKSIKAQFSSLNYIFHQNQTKPIQFSFKLFYEKCSSKFWCDVAILTCLIDKRFDLFTTVALFRRFSCRLM